MKPVLAIYGFNLLCFVCGYALRAILCHRLGGHPEAAKEKP